MVNVERATLQTREVPARGGRTVVSAVGEDGQTVGSISYGKNKRAPGIFIQALEILSAFRRRGFGAELLRRILERHKDEDVRLEVAASNQPAVDLYTRHGFEREGEVRDQAGNIFLRMVRRAVNHES